MNKINNLSSFFSTPSTVVHDCLNESPPEDARPVHIYFMKKDPGMFNTTNISNVINSLPKRIVYANSWSEFAEIFTFKPETICVNACHFQEASIFEITNMIDTFSKLVGMEKEVSITIGVHKDTPIKLIREAQKSRITGLIPASEDFGIEECVKGVRAQWSNVSYWPKYIIQSIEGVKKESSNKGTIKLTPRQQQIFDIITTRGCSNKHVAKLLGLSESTVKLHMGAIFKKYGVKSRTQLAVFSKGSNK